MLLDLLQSNNVMLLSKIAENMRLLLLQVLYTRMLSSFFYKNAKDNDRIRQHVLPLAWL